MAGQSSTNQTRRDQFSPGAQNYADTPLKQPGMPSNGMPYPSPQDSSFPQPQDNHPNDPYGMGGEVGNNSPQQSGHIYDVGYKPPAYDPLQYQGGSPSSGSSYNFSYQTPAYSPNPYLEDQVKGITTGFNRNLQEQVLPGLRSKFIGSGGLGGSRQGIAEGLATARSGEGLSNAITNLYANDYENSQNRNLQAGIAAGNSGMQARAMDMQNELARLNSERNFYSTNRGQDISQLGLAAGLLGQANQGFLGQGQGIYGLGLQEQNAPWQQLQNYSGLLQPYTQAGATNQNSQQYTYNPTMQYIGANMQAAASMAPYIMSDINAKENIRRVGKTDEGLNVYTYNYKGDNTPQMGVMAQEVEAKKPEALGPTINGFKTVRYGLLGG
jgi:hypothetical protein